MVERVLAPSKESANTVLFLRDVIALMGGEPDKSAKSLIDAAVRFEEAFESRAAMLQAKQLRDEAEKTLDRANIEAAAITESANKAIAQEDAALEQRKAVVVDSEAQASARASKLTEGERQVAARDSALTAREAALKTGEAALSETRALLAETQKGAQAAQRAANEAKAEHEAMMQRLRDAAA